MPQVLCMQWFDNARQGCGVGTVIASHDFWGAQRNGILLAAKLFPCTSWDTTSKI